MKIDFILAMKHVVLVLYSKLKIVTTISSSIQEVNFSYEYVGRIINVSSVAGLYGYPGLSVYSATKHALEGYSAALRQECAKFNVNVVTVQPGDFSKATHLLDNHHK